MHEPWCKVAKYLLIFISRSHMRFQSDTIHCWISHATIVKLHWNLGSDTARLTSNSTTFHLLPHCKVFLHSWKERANLYQKSLRKIRFSAQKTMLLKFNWSLVRLKSWQLYIQITCFAQCSLHRGKLTLEIYSKHLFINTNYKYHLQTTTFQYL